MKITPLKKGLYTEDSKTVRLLKEPMANQKVYQLKTKRLS